MTCNTPKSTSLPHWRRRKSRSEMAADIRQRRGKRLTASYRGSLISTKVSVPPWWVGLNAKRQLTAADGVNAK